MSNGKTRARELARETCETVNKCNLHEAGHSKCVALDHVEQTINTACREALEEASLEAEATVCAYQGYEEEKPLMVVVRESVLELKKRYADVKDGKNG